MTSTSGGMKSSPVTPRHIMSSQVTPHHVTSCRVKSRHTTSSQGSHDYVAEAWAGWVRGWVGEPSRAELSSLYGLTYLVTMPRIRIRIHIHIHTHIHITW